MMASFTEGLGDGATMQFNNDPSSGIRKTVKILFLFSYLLKGEEIGFGETDYIFTITGGSNVDMSSDYNFFIPFYCPGCPDKYELPDQFSNYDDFKSNYTVDESAVPDGGNYSVSDFSNFH